MRILVIANSESFHTARFANEFVKRGHDVLLLSATQYLERVVKYDDRVQHKIFLKLISNTFIKLFKSRIQNFNPANSKPYHPFNFLILFRMIYLFFFINKILKNEKFDAVFAMNLTTNGLFAARINRKVKKVCTTLGCDLRLAKWNSVQIINNNKLVYRYINKNLDYIFTGEGEMFDVFFNNKVLFPINQKLIQVSSLGVDINLFNPIYKSVVLKKQLYGLKENDILALCFRQPRPTLDYPLILKSLVSIINKHPNFYFAIGTGGQSYPDLIEIAEVNHIQDHVLFMPNIDYNELHLYLAQGDIYIDPVNIKLNETIISSGISNSLLESMACGLIPVVGNRDGIEVYFNEEVEEFVYQDMKKNLQIYIEKAIGKYKNDDYKRLFRALVVEKTSWIRNIDKLLEAYK